jgi:hypothetical protein
LSAAGVEAAAAVSRLAVFGYGSLVSAASAAQTLGRPVQPPVPARLPGYRRCWTLARDNARSEKTFARADGSLPSYCVGLNLEPDRDAPPPNGALIALTEAELERLDLREVRYRRIEVSAAIAADAARDFDAVFAYSARPEHHHPAPPPGAILIAGYLRTVEAAFDALGPGELRLFRATTADHGVEVAEAHLVRDAIPEGNPRDW